MIEVNTNFIFHNVGQGLFYSGKIGNINFIYDCGSMNTECVNKVVKSYKKKVLGKEKISMFVISHFDKDHVSGLENLLKDREVEWAILPYLTPLERLIIASRWSTVPRWYYHFLSNPVEFLFERNVKRVIFIGSGENKEKGKDITPMGKEPSPSEDVKIEIDNLPEDEELWRRIIEQEDEQWKKWIEEKKILPRNHWGLIRIPRVWEFVFFNYKVDEGAIRSFKKCLKERGIKEKEIRDIIREKRMREEIKKCYKLIKTDLNLTCLVMYHGGNYKMTLGISKKKNCSSLPRQLRDQDLLKKYRANLLKWKLTGTSIKNGGQLLLGDANLKRHYKDLLEHFKNFLPMINLVLVPHHGSKNSWNSKILSDINACKIWVVSAGIKNSYSHPSKKVILEIVNNRFLLWCNEKEKIAIGGKDAKRILLFSNSSL